MSDINIDELDRLANALDGEAWVTQSTHRSRYIYLAGENDPIISVIPMPGDLPSPERDAQYIKTYDRAAFIAAADPHNVRAIIDRLRKAEDEIAGEPEVKSHLPAEFQRLWEACVGLSEKADFKAVMQYLYRLEDRIKASDATIDQLTERLEAFENQDLIPFDEIDDPFGADKEETA